MKYEIGDCPEIEWEIFQTFDANLNNDLECPYFLNNINNSKTVKRGDYIGIGIDIDSMDELCTRREGCIHNVELKNPTRL